MKNEKSFLDCAKYQIPERTLEIIGARREVLCELHIFCIAQKRWRKRQDEQKVITFSFDVNRMNA